MKPSKSRPEFVSMSYLLVDVKATQRLKRLLSSTTRCVFDGRDHEKEGKEASQVDLRLWES